MAALSAIRDQRRPGHRRRRGERAGRGPRTRGAGDRRDRAPDLPGRVAEHTGTLFPVNAVTRMTKIPAGPRGDGAGGGVARHGPDAGRSAGITNGYTLGPDSLLLDDRQLKPPGPRKKSWPKNWGAPGRTSTLVAVSVFPSELS